MKINNNLKLGSTLFDSLNIGDVFVEFEGPFVYMKIPEFTISSKDINFRYNAYNLSENTYAYFEGLDYVLPCQNAILNLS